jgi:hypothetical protein
MLIIGCDFHTRYEQIATLPSRRVARTGNPKTVLGAPPSVFF